MDHLHSSQPADRREQSALSLDGSIRNVRRGSGPGYSPNCLSRVQPRYYEKWALITKNDNIMAAQGSKGQAMLRTVSVLMLMTIAPPVIAEIPTDAAAVAQERQPAAQAAKRDCGKRSEGVSA
jgi:hypothetical protein